jgi:hypothetical protein
MPLWGTRSASKMFNTEATGRATEKQAWRFARRSIGVPREAPNILTSSVALPVASVLKILLTGPTRPQAAYVVNSALSYQVSE